MGLSLTFRSSPQKIASHPTLRSTKHKSQAHTRTRLSCVGTQPHAIPASLSTKTFLNLNTNRCSLRLLLLPYCQKEEHFVFQKEPNGCWMLLGAF
jgi:hypothetical protein